MAKGRVLVVASTKGGVGKSATSWSVAIAAAARGQDVVVIDLDTSCSLTMHVQRRAGDPDITAVLDGAMALEEVLVEAHPRILLAPGSRNLYDSTVTKGVLRPLVAAAAEIADLVVIDTPPSRAAMPAALGVADIIVIPTILDETSMKVTVETVELVRAVGVGGRVAGILPTQVRRPMGIVARAIAADLEESGVGLGCMYYHSARWPPVLEQSTLGDYPDLLRMADDAYLAAVNNTVSQEALDAWFDRWWVRVRGEESA